MNIADRRIMNELASIQKDRIPGIEVKIDGMRLWHFVMRGPKDSVFYNGRYHGNLHIPENYPNEPPIVIFDTENGRYKPKHFLCLFGHNKWSASYTLKSVLISIRQNFIGPAIFGEGVIAVPDKPTCIKNAEESLNGECPFCGKYKELEFLEDTTEIPKTDQIKLEPVPAKESENVKNVKNEEVKIEIEKPAEKIEEQKSVSLNYSENSKENVKKEDENSKKEEEKKDVEIEPERPKEMGEWWYEVRAAALMELNDELQEVWENQEMYKTCKILRLVSIYLEIFLMQIAYSPLTIINYHIYSILVLLASIGILIALITQNEIGGGCFAAIVIHYISLVPVFVNKIYFIIIMIDSKYRQPNMCIMGLDAIGQIIYFWTGLSVLIYTVYDGESLKLGTAFLVMFFCAQIIRYLERGIKYAVLSLMIAPFIFEWIFRLTCCKPWKGVDALDIAPGTIQNVDKCVICLSELGKDDKLIGLTCHPNHIFHQTCIVEWIKKKQECPYCKKLVNTDSHPLFVQESAVSQ